MKKAQKSIGIQCGCQSCTITIDCACGITYKCCDGTLLKCNHFEWIWERWKDAECCAKLGFKFLKFVEFQ